MYNGTLDWNIPNYQYGKEVKVLDGIFEGYLKITKENRIWSVLWKDKVRGFLGIVFNVIKDETHVQWPDEIF